MLKYYSISAQSTFEIAFELAQKLKKGDIVLLLGELGAGKSVFARGLAAGFGVEGHVTSPTFTTMQAYEGTCGNFYHFDLYRMDDPEQLFETGLNEYIGTDGLAVIEWPQNAELDPPGAYRVVIERAGEDEMVQSERPIFGDNNQAELDGDCARMITIFFPEDM